MAQWLKRFFDLTCGSGPQDYNPDEARGNAVVDLSSVGGGTGAPNADST